ncbi:unnamed protein product [Symbiodinium sp. CCMP2456]|nr:unnamed protein product [Symbiodinium sp. CCMP2456]
MPDTSEFPDVPEHEPVTRRDQFAVKDSKGGRGGRGGRGRGRGRATAAKSKIVRKASDGTLEGQHTSGSTGPVEVPPLRRKRPLEDEDEAAGAGKQGRAKAKAKASAKAKAKASPKASAKAKAKASPKAKGKAKAKARAEPDAAEEPGSKQCHSKGKASPAGDEKLAAAKQRTASLLESMQKPSPVDFTKAAHNRDLPNPDHLRKALIFEIMTCLVSCNQLGKKAKHNHVEKLVPPSTDMRFELYWSRASVGIKIKSPGSKEFRQAPFSKLLAVKKEMVAEVQDSDAAPREPGDMDWTDEKGQAPVADTVGTKAGLLPSRRTSNPFRLPELVKLMDTVHGHMANIGKAQKSIQDSESGKLPPAKEELMKDLDKVDDTFRTCFRELADFKADLTLQEKETAGQVIRHGVNIIDETLRWHNKSFGYKYEKQRWQQMVVIYASAETMGPAFLEAALIQRFKGQQGCRNERDGGDTVCDHLQGLQQKIDAVRNTVKKPTFGRSVPVLCADLIALESRIKLIVGDVRSRKRPADVEAERAACTGIIQEANAIMDYDLREEGPGRAAVRHGLRLDVPISFTTLGGFTQYPYIEVSSWIQTLDLKGKLHHLVSVGESAMPATLERFWTNFRTGHGSHQVFQSGVDLQNAIPVYLHGDEGTTYKKDGCLCIALQCPLGKGTRTTKLGDLADIGEDARQRLNYVGHSFETRFLLISAMKEEYRLQPEMYDEVIETAVRSLDNASRQGVVLRSRTPAYAGTLYRVQPWAQEPVFTRVLMHEPDKKESFHKENRKTNYIQRITRDTLAYSSEAKDSLGGWNKGQLTTNLCQFVEWFCNFKQLDKSADERDRLIASSSRALNLFMKLLYAAGLWLEIAQATRIASAGRHFLAAYSRLARLSLDAGELRYTMIPKIHMLWHVIENMTVQCESFEIVENPMAEAVAVDEDFIGRYCALTRSVSPRLRVLRSLERYLTQVALLWKRQEE